MSLYPDGTSRNRIPIPLWFIVSLAPSVILAALSLMAPANVLDKMPWLTVLANVIGHVVPSFDGLVEISRFPQVTAMTYALAWLVFPMQCGFIVIAMVANADVKRMIDGARRGHWGRSKVIIFFGLLVLIWIWALLTVSFDPSFMKGFGPSESRVTLALLGTFQFWAISFCIGIFCAVLLRTKKGDF